MPISPEREPIQQPGEQPEATLPTTVLSPEELAQKLSNIEKPKEPLIKVESRVGQSRTEEEVDKMKAIREESAKFVDMKAKIAQKERDLRAKQANKELLSASELAFLKSREGKVEAVEAKEEQPKEVEKVADVAIAQEEARKSTLKTELLKRFEEMTVQIADGAETGEIKPENKEKLDIAFVAAQGFYVEVTGRDLNKDIRDRAKTEAEAQGRKVVSKQEFFSPENVARTEKQSQQKRWAVGIQERWAALSDQEKQKYGAGIKDYANQLEDKRKNLEKKGFVFSKDVYYTLLREGFNPQDIKKKGWWSRKMIISSTEKGKVVEIDSKKDFAAWTAKLQETFNATVKKESQEELEVKYKKGRAEWMKRKIRKTGEVIIEAAGGKPSKATSPEGKVESTASETAIENLDWEVEAAKITERYSNRMSEMAKLAGDVADKFKMPMNGEAGLVKLFTTGERGDDLPKDIIPERLLEAIRKKGQEIADDQSRALIGLNQKRLLAEQKMRDQMIKSIEVKLGSI